MSLKSIKEFIKIEKRSLARSYINQTKKIDKMNDIIILTYSLARAWIKDYGLMDKGGVNIYCYTEYGSKITLSITLNKEQNIEKDFNIFLETYENTIKKCLKVKEYETNINDTNITYTFGDFWDKSLTITVYFGEGKCERVLVKEGTKIVEDNVYEVRCK